MRRVLIVFAIMIVPFVVGAYYIGLIKVFAPQTENVRREVFENTKSYIHGASQDLAKYKYEFETADNQEDRDAIASLIRTRFAELDTSKLQSRELRIFLTSLRGY